jgi:hypothetical protein
MILEWEWNNYKEARISNTTHSSQNTSKELCILPTECIFVFRMMLITNSDYVPKLY